MTSGKDIFNFEEIKPNVVFPMTFSYIPVEAVEAYIKYWRGRGVPAVDDVLVCVSMDAKVITEEDIAKVLIEVMDEKGKVDEGATINDYAKAILSLLNKGGE